VAGTADLGALAAAAQAEVIEGTAEQSSIFDEIFVFFLIKKSYNLFVEMEML
jgi:hypothetical protein